MTEAGLQRVQHVSVSWTFLSVLDLFSSNSPENQSARPLPPPSCRASWDNNSVAKARFTRIRIYLYHIVVRIRLYSANILLRIVVSDLWRNLVDLVVLPPDNVYLFDAQWLQFGHFQTGASIMENDNYFLAKLINK